MRIFGFDLEFNHDKLRDKIEASKNKDVRGYICVVDGPSLARSYKSPSFLKLLQEAYANTCDGGSIASMASHLCKQKLKAYTGPEIFAEYITNTKFKQILLGNTEEKYIQVKKKVATLCGNTKHLHYIPLPFASVEEFDYASISKQIAEIDADLIWVSLGAPKQEYFMQKLLPYLQHGIMLGVGAAFSFYLGELKDYKFKIGETRLNWIFRLFTEPRKQFKRVSTIIRYYPAIYCKEKKVNATREDCRH